MVRLDFTWSGLVFSEPLKIWSGLVFSDSQALLPLSKVVCWAWMGNIWLSVNVWAQLRTETKTKTKLSPTCQLLILKKKWRKKMKRDLHMMQLHKQLQATFNFLGKAVCFLKRAHIRCCVKNACYLLFNILRPYLSRKHRHKYSYLSREYLSVGLDMTISVSVNNIHLQRMFLGGDEAAARSLSGICGSWTFQRDRPPPSSSHPRPLSWTTTSSLRHSPPPPPSSSSP